MNIVAFEMHQPAGGELEGSESPEVRIVFRRSETDELIEEGWTLERELWSPKSTRSYVSETAAALPPSPPGQPRSTLGQQVAKAQAEIATWPDSAREAVGLPPGQPEGCELLRPLKQGELRNLIEREPQTVFVRLADVEAVVAAECEKLRAALAARQAPTPALQEGSEQPPEPQQEGQPAALRAAPAGQLCIDRQELRQLSIRLVEDGARARSEHFRDGVTHGVFSLHEAILKLSGAAPVEQTTSTDTNNEKGQA